MGVVARRAAETALARAETATHFHLFRLPDELGFLLLRPAVDGEEFDQRKPRAIVEHFAVETFDPVVALEVALLADSVSQRRLQMPRIDDRPVSSIDHLRVLRVQFAWAVAPLATNRVAAEDWLFIPVQGVRDRFDSVGMAKQTASIDWPIKVEITHIIPG
jgi:hypothetical protein